MTPALTAMTAAANLACDNKHHDPAVVAAMKAAFALGWAQGQHYIITGETA